ncbi:MAG: hypothetical protein ACRBI6_04670 [Acidimicrobiales bacterium]
MPKYDDEHEYSGPAEYDDGLEGITDEIHQVVDAIGELRKTIQAAAILRESHHYPERYNPAEGERQPRIMAEMAFARIMEAIS